LRKKIKFIISFKIKTQRIDEIAKQHKIYLRLIISRLIDKAHPCASLPES